MCVDADKKVQELENENDKLETERDNADGRTAQAEKDNRRLVGELATGNQEIGVLKAKTAQLQDKLDRRWSPLAIAGVGAAVILVLEGVALVVWILATPQRGDS